MQGSGWIRERPGGLDGMVNIKINLGGMFCQGQRETSMDWCWNVEAHWWTKTAYGEERTDTQRQEPGGYHTAVGGGLHILSGLSDLLHCCTSALGTLLSSPAQAVSMPTPLQKLSSFIHFAGLHVKSSKSTVSIVPVFSSFIFSGFPRQILRPMNLQALLRYSGASVFCPNVLLQFYVPKNLYGISLLCPVILSIWNNNAECLLIHFWSSCFSEYN